MAPLRGTILATLAAVGLLCVLMFPGALFRGEVLSQADFLLDHEPWRAVAPAGFVAGNSELSDQATQFQPWNLLLRERLAGGALPLWNPRAGAGEPLLADLQSAVLSPFTWLSLLFPFGAGLLVAALAQLLCAGLGTALFARRLRCSLPACVFAALAFTFGGFQFLWLQHPHAAVSCLLPWLLLLADQWVEAASGDAPSVARRAWLRPAFALLVAALILCGHIETALHVALAVAAWTVLASAGQPLAARLVLLADMGLWSVLGAALAGVQLLPFLEYLELSENYAKRSGFQELWRRVPWDRWPLVAGAAALLVVLVLTWRRALRALLDAGAPSIGDARGAAAAGGPGAPASRLAAANARADAFREAAERSSRNLRRAFRGFVLAAVVGGLLLALLEAAGFSPFHRLLFHPDAYGNPLPGRGMPFDGPRAYVNINNGYAGLITLFLAFFAVMCGPRGRRGVNALGWLWLGAFLLAYELPIVSQLVNRLPLLNLALNYRFTLVVGFCSALLAAIGLDALCRPATRSRPAPAFWLLGGVVVGALALAPTGRAALQLATAGGDAPRAAPADGASPADAPFDVAQRPPGPRWWALGAGAVLLLMWGTRDGSLRRRGAWLAAGALVLLGADLFLFGRGMHPSAPAAHVFPPTPVTDFLAEQPAGGRIWAVRRNVLMPNTAGVYGLCDLRGYDALGVERMAWLREALRPKPDPRRAAPQPPGTSGAIVRDVAHEDDANDAADDRADGPASGAPDGLHDASRTAALDLGSALCDVLDVRFVLAPPGWSPPQDSRLVQAFASGDCIVWRNERAVGRAFVARSALSIGPYLHAEPGATQVANAALVGMPAEASQRLRRLEMAHAIGSMYRTAPLAERELLIEGDAPLAGLGATVAPRSAGDAPEAAGAKAAVGAGTAAAEGAGGSVTWRRDEPEHQELDVSAPAPGWLCVADAFYPGWTARVNGAPAPIVPAFLALRAVAVPAGSSRVEFRYEPASVRWGAWLSAGAALVVLIGLLAAARRGRWPGARRVRESAATSGAGTVGATGGSVGGEQP